MGGRNCFEGDAPRARRSALFDASAGEIVATAFTPDSRTFSVNMRTQAAFWSTDRWHPNAVALDYGDQDGLAMCA